MDKSPDIGISSPHSVEAEEAVLGSLFINSDSYDEIADFLNAADFFIVRNRRVFEAIASLHDRGEAVDNLTVTEELRSKKQLSDVGGPGYIAHLVNSVPTHVNIEAYARTVARLALRSRLISVASQMATLAMGKEPEEAILEKSEMLFNTIQSSRNSDGFVGIRQAVGDYYSHVERMYNQKGDFLGYPTGYVEMDKMLSGIQKDSVYLFGARPGVGKTTMLLNMAIRMCIEQKLSIGFFTMEMSVERITNRMNAILGNLPAERLQRGALNEKQWGTFIQVTTKLSNAKMIIDPTPALSLVQLRRKARKMVAQGVRIIFLDYVQLMKGSSGKNRLADLEEISRGIKTLAMSLKIPFVVAVQLNRDVERRENKEPQLSDIRECGSFEADADVVVMLHRPDMYEGYAPEQKGHIRFFVRKDRNGPIGDFTLFFDDETTRIVPLGSPKTFHVREIEE